MTAVAVSEINTASAAPRPADTIPATLLLTTLSVVTVIGFGRVFSDWGFLRPMVIVVIGVHVCCLALRLARVPGYIALPLEVLVLFGLLAWKYYPTTLSGPLPTRETWDFLRSDLQLARDQFPNAVAPVAPIGGFVVAAAAACGLSALLSDAFAFRAYGRAEAAVPSAVLFIFASALGSDNHRVLLTSLWLCTALALIAVLRAVHAQADFTWIGRKSRVLVSVLPVAMLLAGCAAVSAAAVGPRLPGAGEKGLIESNKRNNVTEVLSPLVDIRSRLLNLGPRELFTVTSAEPHYWRIAGLSVFDGTRWEVGNRNLHSVSGSFADVQDSTTVAQSFEILALGGRFLPAVYSPIAINRSDIFWVEDSGTLIMTEGDGLTRGESYDLRSAVADKNPSVLRASSSDHPDDRSALELPDNFPDSIRATALEVTADAPTVFDKALALQNWFRDTFEYDTSVQKGHSNNALLNFLRNRRGYCEQFSGTYAAMMRSIDIPARVAVGFTYGEFRADGKYHVLARNAHAWPEVWFDDVGWVSFEPTPSRGEPGAEEYTGVVPSQAPPYDPTNAGSSGNPSAAAPSSTVAAGVGAPSSTVPRDVNGPTTLPKDLEAVTTSTSDGGLSTITIALVVAIALVALWVLLLPYVLRVLQRRRRARDPVTRITRAWAQSANALSLIGLEPVTGETPLEHARRAERLSGIDHRTLRELATSATAATFGGIGDDHTANRCEHLAIDVLQAVKNRLSVSERVGARIDPRRARLLVAD